MNDNFNSHLNDKKGDTAIALFCFFIVIFIVNVIWYFILDLEGLEKSGKKWEEIGYDGMDLVFLNVVVVRHWAVGNWIADKKIFEKKSLIVWWGFLYFILD